MKLIIPVARTGLPIQMYQAAQFDSHQLSLLKSVPAWAYRKSEVGWSVELNIMISRSHTG